VRILEIEVLFQNAETLDKILEECKDDFEVIDNNSNNVLKSRVANNPEEAKGALVEITGAYCNLTTILSIAESEKTNREEREYNRLRIEIENAGNKFVSAQADKQASAFVGPYRRIRNLIEGYVNAAEKQISTLQSVLKYEGGKYNAEPK
jgi:hypothetical protein